MRRFLITGGAGFIGSHIAEKIVKEKLGEVVIFDNFLSGHERNILHLKDNVSFIKGDTRKIQDVKKACDGIDIIFHEAAFVSAFDSYNKPDLTDEINVGGTRNVLDTALEKGVRRVLLSSSAAVYGTKSDLPNSECMEPKPKSPYAISKVQNEKDARIYADQKGLETVCLRYFNVFGPRQDPSSEYSGVISRFVERLNQDKAPIVYGDGTQTRDFVYVSDVAQANMLAAMSDRCGNGEILNIGTGVETSLLQLVDVLKIAYQRDIEPEFLPSRKSDITRSVAATERARELLRFEAEVDFTSGINFLVEAIRT